jgi:Tfp pilus assembly protein PilE
VRVYHVLRAERGITVVEAVVAIVVVGALAAVLMPSLSNGDGEENAQSDAEAKAIAVTAARAIERCRAQNGGSFANCTKDALISIEPGLAAAGDQLGVATDAQSYEIGVASKRNPRISFTVSRAADGTTARACTTDGEWDGGCRPRFAGTW